MKRKKNRQYYKSKKRVLKYREIDTDNVVVAIRIATEVVMSAMQLQILLSRPIPKHERCGFSCVAESGPEIFNPIRYEQAIQTMHSHNNRTIR